MNSDIEHKRTELKNEIDSGKKRTIVDALLYRIGKRGIISTWSGILLIFFLTLLISVILGLLSGGISTILKSFESLPGGQQLWVPWIIFNLLSCTALMVLANVFIHRMFDLFRDPIIDQAANMETLDRLSSAISGRLSTRSSKKFLSFKWVKPRFQRKIGIILFGYLIIMKG